MGESIEGFLACDYPALVASVDRVFGGAVPAEDVVQEALVRAWQRDSADPIASLPGWVRVVATNLGRDHLRREGAIERAYRRWAGERPADPVESVLGDRLGAAVDRLPPRQRQVVTLHYRDDLAVDDIASSLGLSTGTVKSTLSRARDALADMLRPGGDRPMKAWFLAGSHPADYEYGVEPDERARRTRVAYLRARGADPKGFGTLMQTIAADAVAGHRVRFSGTVRADGVTGWAGLWMRVDGIPGSPMLAFDNMQSRPIAGSQAWARYEVVLDVPDSAVAVALGVLLNGPGALSLSSFQFETVSNDVAITTVRRPIHPENLDFSEDA